MPLIRYLLIPFTAIFYFLTQFRNWLYEKGIFRSFTFDRVVISVGNLTVGGTGKTPMTEYLTRLLHVNYRLAFVSRGYKRRTKGFRIADDNDNAQTIGDEPFQYYRKFCETAVVAVGEDRALAIPKILYKHPETEVVLLDDGFQHRTVKPDINILLTDYRRLFTDDWLLPTGNLRESRVHARRADVVVVTKCPELIGAREKQEIRDAIEKYTRKDVGIFFSRVRHLEPVAAFDNGKSFTQNVFLFAGIANSKPLLEYVDDQFHLLGHKFFPDHYNFTSKVLSDKVLAPFEHLAVGEKCLLTTEKDMVRLLSLADVHENLTTFPLFYLPIEMEIIHEDTMFDTYILDKLRSASENKGNIAGN